MIGKCKLLKIFESRDIELVKIVYQRLTDKSPYFAMNGTTIYYCQNVSDNIEEWHTQVWDDIYTNLQHIMAGIFGVEPIVNNGSYFHLHTNINFYSHHDIMLFMFKRGTWNYFQYSVKKNTWSVTKFDNKLIYE